MNRLPSVVVLCASIWANDEYAEKGKETADNESEDLRAVRALKIVIEYSGPNNNADSEKNELRGYDKLGHSVYKVPTMHIHLL